jgi:hypothetical protein
MTKLLVAFVAIILYKFVNNFIRYGQCKYFLKKYHEYLEKPTWAFEECAPTIIKLFERAGIEDSKVPYIHPAGLGYVSTGHASVFSNLLATREDVVNVVLHQFHRAIGTYRSRMLEAFNPLYWIEFVTYLPKHIITYLGVPRESAITKVLQVLYWVLAPLLGTAYALFKIEIDQFLKDFIKSLIT